LAAHWRAPPFSSAKWRKPIAERLAAYQAWVLPQCGQPTEVETGASNTSPHWQV